MDEQDFHRAVEAYRFFYPTASMEGLINQSRELGIEDSRQIMIRPLYGSAVLDLRLTGPLVIDLPADSFVGQIDDHHQRPITELRRGRHLLLPPDFEGEVPDGYHVSRSPTYTAMLTLRALELREVRVHSLADPNGVFSFVEVTDGDLAGTLVRWQDNLEYWIRLHDVIDDERALDEFRPMLDTLAALGLERGKPFRPDARMKRILERAAKAGLEQLRAEGLASER